MPEILAAADSRQLLPSPQSGSLEERLAQEIIAGLRKKLSQGGKVGLVPSPLVAPVAPDSPKDVPQTVGLEKSGIGGLEKPTSKLRAKR